MPIASPTGMYCDGSPPRIEEPSGVDGWSTLTQQRIVSMVTMGNRVFVATDRRVYELMDGVWHPMVFSVGEWPKTEATE